MRDLKGRLDLCSINTATLGHRASIGPTIEAVARAGFGGIAPWRRDLEGEAPGAVATQIRDAGLKVSGYCRSSYFTASSAAERTAAIDENRRAVDQAAILGAPVFVLVAGSLPAASKDLSRARTDVEAGIAALLEHARQTGVRLAIEPLHPMTAADRSCINTLEQALDLADLLEPTPGPSPDLGIAADAYHIWWDPKLDAQIARAGAANRLFSFHVCDWLVETRDLVTDRGMMGDGVIDLKPLRAKMERAGYDGAVEVEIFSAANWWRRPMDETLAVAAERLQSLC